MFNKLQDRIHYRFKNESLIQRAVTHSSYANESKEKMIHNERMEFLGDAVLSIIVADYLYQNFQLREGDLTKLRASLVCEQTLFQFANDIMLGDELLLGHGEDITGGRTRPSVVSDAFEALIAGIYLDGGMENAKAFVLPFIQKELEKNETPFNDYKTKLQEVIQQNPEEKISYVLVSESGPDHDKQFTIEVHLNSNVIGVGTSKSKKGAEQAAAKEALHLMGME